MTSTLFKFPQPDWEERILAGKIPVDLHRYDAELNKKRVDMGVRIFGNLRLADVPGQPKLRDACPPWFTDFARLIFGSVGDDGRNLLPNSLLSVAKKNSKTSYGALMLLAQMLMSPRPRATFLMVGPTQSISELAFQQIVGAINADETLASILHVRDHLKRIEHRKSGCVLAVKTFSMDVATGAKISGCLLDEAHLLHRDEHRRVIGQLRGGMASIPEASMTIISTHADVVPSGFWGDEIKKARAVRDGDSNLAGYLPYIFEPPQSVIDDDKAIIEPENWKFGNPNLGYSVNLEWLKDSFEDARIAGQQEINRWLSQHANLEVKAHRLSDDAWSATYEWPKAKTETFTTLNELIDASDYITVGLDGGGLDDLLSITFLGKMYDGNWGTFQQSFVQQAAMERQKINSGKYADFMKAGDLHLCGVGEDVVKVVNLLMDADRRGHLVAVGVDPAGIANEIAVSLAAAGFDRERIVQVAQGYRLQPAMISVGRRLAEGRLVHAGQPLFDWSIANCIVNDRGFISKADTKARAGAAKIDPVVSLLCATMVMLEIEAATVASEAQPDGEGGSHVINAWSDPINFMAIEAGGTMLGFWDPHEASGGSIIYRGV